MNWRSMHVRDQLVVTECEFSDRSSRHGDWDKPSDRACWLEHEGPSSQVALLVASTASTHSHSEVIYPRGFVGLPAIKVRTRDRKAC